MNGSIDKSVIDGQTGKLAEREREREGERERERKRERDV